MPKNDEIKEKDDVEAEKTKKATLQEQANELFAEKAESDDKKESNIDYSDELDMMIKLQQEIMSLYKEMGSALMTYLNQSEETQQESQQQEADPKELNLDSNATTEKVNGTQDEVTEDDEDMEMTTMSDTITQPADAVNSSDFEALDKNNDSAKGVDVDQELEEDVESTAGFTPG